MPRVYSIFMDNVAECVVQSQKAVVDRFLPPGCIFTQYKVSTRHPEALQKCVDEVKEGIIIFLDIDAVPVSTRSFEYLIDHATEGKLTGAIQRANHIRNDQHLYVGPFCMAFDVELYRKLGSPTFNETYRGDVGEELTYAWERRGYSLQFLYPSHIVNPKWELGGGFKFGYGTTYSGMFYHTFCIRCQEQQDMFTNKCKELLERSIL